MRGGLDSSEEDVVVQGVQWGRERGAVAGRRGSKGRRAKNGASGESSQPGLVCGRVAREEVM